MSREDQPRQRTEDAAVAPQAIELHIEELILHGFAPQDRHHIGQAVKRELARLFAQGGVPSSLARGGEAAHLDAGAFEMGRGSKGEAIGTQVARAVYEGLSR